MAILINNSVASRALKEKGVVILPLRQYEKIKKTIERLEEAKRLATEEAKVLKTIAEGEKEYRKGKLKPLKSLVNLC
jgi:hypothetical protein